MFCWYYKRHFAGFKFINDISLGLLIKNISKGIFKLFIFSNLVSAIKLIIDLVFYKNFYN